MMTDLYWDEVLLTNNPDSKELEVSFKKIDGDGFLLSQGNEPGTNGGVTEGSDGSKPPTDDEGDWEDEDDGGDGGGGGGGGGDPIPPDPDAHPECAAQDCDALDNITDPPPTANTLFGNSFSSTLGAREISGTVRIDRTTGEDWDDESFSIYRRDDVVGSGPCGKYTVYAPVIGGASGASNVRYVSTNFEAFHGEPVNPGDHIIITASAQVVMGQRNEDGTLPTEGTTSFGIASNSGLLWLSDFGPGAPPAASGAGSTVVVFADHSTGIVSFTYGGAVQQINNSNDIGGAYSVTTKNEYRISEDGRYAYVDWEMEVAGRGTSTPKIGGGGVYDGGFPGAITKGWLPRIQDGGQPNYFVSRTGRTFALGSVAGTDTQIDEWVDAFERSFQEYTPPDYCERIPT